LSSREFHGRGKRKKNNEILESHQNFSDNSYHDERLRLMNIRRDVTWRYVTSCRLSEKDSRRSMNVWGQPCSRGWDPISMDCTGWVSVASMCVERTASMWMRDCGPQPPLSLSMNVHSPPIWRRHLRFIHSTGKQKKSLTWEAINERMQSEGIHFSRYVLRDLKLFSRTSNPSSPLPPQSLQISSCQLLSTF
jgi:hypothetical protein